MRHPKMVKVSKEDYELLQLMKEGNYGAEEIKQLDRNREIAEENKQEQRLDTIKRNEMTVIQKLKEIDYKQDQLDSGRFTEASEDFVDKTKPRFMLESEILAIKFDIEGHKKVIKATKGEHEKSKGD